MNDSCRWPKQHVLGGQQSRRKFHNDGIFRVAKAVRQIRGSQSILTFVLPCSVLLHGYLSEMQQYDTLRDEFTKSSADSGQCDPLISVEVIR